MKKIAAAFVLTVIAFPMASPSLADTNMLNDETNTATCIPDAAEITPYSERQFADEIIRRIRRLGVHVIRFPNTRPILTVGEIC